jgi:hypothetical protein
MGLPLPPDSIVLSFDHFDVLGERVASFDPFLVYRGHQVVLEIISVLNYVAVDEGVS